MRFRRVNLAFFSATGTTSKIVSAIEGGLGVEQKRVIDLADMGHDDILISGDEVVIFGVPVFSGRVPELARKGLAKIRGNNTPAIIVCVYGNREFDDALIELKDIVEGNGFNLLSAGAFIAQHSIFEKVAAGRPDFTDLIQAKEFGAKSIQGVGNSPLEVPGNRPYRAVKSIPLSPHTNSKCNRCGLCAKQCPMQAIDANNPKKTDKNLCIACAHCIAICPNGAKRFGGLLYWAVSKKFTKDNSQRKENYLIYR